MRSPGPVRIAGDKMDLATSKRGWPVSMLSCHNEDPRSELQGIQAKANKIRLFPF